MIRLSLRAVWLGLVVGTFGALISTVPFVLELEENAGLDWLFLIRGALPAPPNVVVVSIDGASAEALRLPPNPDRWPRSLHADLIERLNEAGAELIAFDMIFDTPRVREHDQRLAEAIKKAGNVILLERLRTEAISAGEAAMLTVDQRVPPIPALRQAAMASAIFPLPVVPVKVSQFWVFGRGPGDIPTLPAISLQAYALPIYADFIDLLKKVRPSAGQLPATQREIIETRSLEQVLSEIRSMFKHDPTLAEEMLEQIENVRNMNEEGRRQSLLYALIQMYGGPESRYLNYYGAARTVRTVAYHEILSRSRGTADTVRGQAVFVGFSERHQPEQKDAFYSVFSQRTGVNLSGVEIAATAFGNLLDGRSVRPLSMWVHLCMVFVWGFVIATGYALLSIRPGVIAAILSLSFYVAVAYQLFESAAIWLPLMVPLAQVPLALFLVLSSKYMEARNRGDRVELALTRYLPASVAGHLAEEIVHIDSNAQLLHGTCLVTDAEQYTALSEKVPAQKLRRLLNDYYRVLFNIVEQRGGFVSDVVGDSMVAVWSSTDQYPAAEVNACHASLEILEAVHRFNRSSGYELPTRLGLHSGELLLGNVGGAGHFEYRAIGDIVNTASRIQGLNKQLRTRLLVSAESILPASGLLSRELGRFLLLGKKKEVNVCELLGIEKDARPADRELIEGFAVALRLFYEERWADAETSFQGVLARFQHDGPSRFYLRVCRQFIAAGRGVRWQGAIAIEQK